MQAMRRAEQKMAPVLTAFKDQVLYLKHNLNAQAIASLQSELSSIESDVVQLIREMEASIREADTFISAMALINASVMEIKRGVLDLPQSEIKHKPDQDAA